MLHALHSRRVVTPQGEQDAAVLIDGEWIAAIKPLSDLDPSIPVEDLGHLALLPGLIDAHTHINEPGRTEWEGFRTATRAAAAGGFTTLVDMPLNCLPETTDVAALTLKREAAFTAGPNRSNQALVDLAFWGGCVDGNQHQLDPLAQAGVPGFKCFLIYPGCDGFTEIDRTNLELALPHIARTGLPLLVHAELAPSIDAAVHHLNTSGADWRKYSTYLASRPDQAELDAISMLIALCRQYRFRLHIVHLSTAHALPLIAAAKAEGLPLTAEACPHHLHCTAEEIPDGATLFKCTPPIRTRANRELLWQALADGTLDLIATDHSPCPLPMKRLYSHHTEAPMPNDALASPATIRYPEASASGLKGPASEGASAPGVNPSQANASHGREYGRFDEAWGGIPSLSTAISVVWTQCHARNLTLSHLANWMSAAPAKLVGLSTTIGSIEPSKQASLIAFDPEANLTITPEVLHYKHAISPYMGQTLRGSVQKTWLRGQPIFTRTLTNNHPTDTFAPPTGREHTLLPVIP